MGTPVPGQTGVIDVKPSTLHPVAGGFAGQQTMFNRAAKDLLTELEKYPDAGGYGTAAQDFAKAYVEVGNLFLDVWAASVASIGGVAVGFATTANNYAKAEAANDASGKTKAQIQPPPQVIENPPGYGSVPDLKWGDDDGGDDFIRSLLECIPDVVWHIIRPLLEHAFRWGKVADVYPFPQQHYLNSLSKSWRGMTLSLSVTESSLTGLVSGITQQSNSEWYDAMRSFCSSLWGTTAWGKNNGAYKWKHDKASSQTATHPVMSVLFDTARKVSDLLYEFAEAAVDLNGKVWDIYMEAVRVAVGKIDLSDGLGMDDVKEGAKTVGRFFKGLASGAAELSVEITLNLDTAALNAVVATYNTRVNGIVPQIRQLKGDLEEAKLSAPTYLAEEARAEAFGARALNDFKKEHQWTVPDDAAGNHKYPLDLANQEYIGNSHGVDKHVGKTDGQLAQRLRDQSNIPAASTFKSMTDAQKYTQLCIDKNNAAIEAYLNSGPPYNPPNRTFTYHDPNGPVTGSSISKADYQQALQNHQSPPVAESHGVQIRVKPDPDPNTKLDPPFTLITSTPTTN
jgi:hypothetical protein